MREDNRQFQVPRPMAFMMVVASVALLLKMVNDVEKCMELENELGKWPYLLLTTYIVFRGVPLLNRNIRMFMRANQEPEINNEAAVPRR